MTTDYTQQSEIPTAEELGRRQPQRFDFFSGTQYNTQPDVGAKVVYGRRQVRGRDDLVFWWLEFRDLRGGLNCVNGDFDWAYDRASASTLDTRFSRTLCLPQLTTNQATPDPTGNLKGFHSAEFLGQMFAAVGSGDDVSLFSEGATGALTAITGVGTTGRPGGSFTCAVPVVVGGGTAATQLLLGRDNAVPMLMTDAAGTLNGTPLHADLNPTWGVIPTPINDRTMLFLANGRIRAKTASSAVGAQPTVPETDVVYPNGGYAGGMLRLDNGPLRGYWGIPFENTTAGVLLFGAEKLHQCKSTNLEGSDPQDIDFGLPGGVLQFALIQSQQAIVAHDGERMVINRGGSEPVPVFTDRVANSDREYRIRNMWVNANEVIYEVNHKASASGSGNTVRHWESYDLETGAVHQISADQTLSNTGVFGVLNAGPGLLSRFTRMVQLYSDGSFRRMYVPRYGENPYLMQRQTSGAGGSTGTEFEASGVWDSPDFELPDLEGLAKLVSKITVLGDVEAAGTASVAGNVRVDAGGVFHTFVTGYDGKSQVARFAGNNSTFYKLHVKITATRTTGSTRFTPNCLPIRIEGYAFRDVDGDRDLIPVAGLVGAAR